MSDLLKVIRAAVQPGEANDSLFGGDKPGANASTTATPHSAASTQEVEMSDSQTKPGAANADAGHAAALAKATTDGQAAGAKAANDRIGAVFGAEGIKGDGKRMAAALDLALASPGMSAEAVIGFVTANVPETKASAMEEWPSYAARRMGGAGLAQPSTTGGAPEKAQAARDVMASAVDRTNKRRK
jgi:hypothetical protein